MHKYEAYGRAVSSAQPLPGFLPSETGAPPEICIHWDRQFREPASFDQVFELSYATAPFILESNFSSDPVAAQGREACYRISYWGGVEFVLKADGSEIWVRTSAEVAADLISAYLTGPVLTYALRLRGVLCLHASVVVVDDCAIAFMAPSGGGKSTTAATLAAMGCPVLSDDVLVLDINGARVMAQPGFPWLRLCDDSADTLSAINGVDVLAGGQGDKQFLELPRHGFKYGGKPMPLAAIYTGIAFGEHLSFEAIGHTRALTLVLGNTHPGVHYRLGPRHRISDLASAKLLVEQVPLRGIRYQRELTALNSFCEAILQDARQLMSRTSGLAS